MGIICRVTGFPGTARDCAEGGKLGGPLLPRVAKGVAEAEAEAWRTR